MIRTTAAAIAAISCLHAHADTLLRPVITSSRVAQSTDQTLAAVTVIDRRQIEASQSHSLPDVLRLVVPGLDFSTTGGTGHQVSAFLRGTSSDNVLVLIDGNIIGSATTGATALELLPLAQVERIEVVRGPRSSLYGSDAIGGIIHIFTRSGADTHSFGIGTRDTLVANAMLGIGDNDNRLTVSADALLTEGFDVTNDGENDSDGFRTGSVNLKLRSKISGDTVVSASFLHAAGETEFDNRSFGNVSDSVQQSIGVGIEHRVTPDWSSNVDIGHTRDRLETGRNTEDFFNPGSFTFEKTLFDTRRQQLRWTNRVGFGKTGLVSAGIDYLNDEVASTTPYAVNERDNRGVYGLVQDKFGRHQLQLSGRIDDNQAFGSHDTYGAAWSYDIDGSVSASLSRSTAFVTPTFNDLYFVDPFFVGNPGLDPETSNTTEAGLVGNHRNVTWDLRLYRTEIEDLIVNVSSNPADPFAAFTTVNADRARIDGAELVLETGFGGWRHSTSFSYVDAVDRQTGLRLQSRAQRTLKLRLSNTFRGHEVTCNLLAQSERYADTSNTQLLPGYGVVNLAVSRALGAHWIFRVKLENLLDRDYTTSVDFYGNTTNNTPRSLLVSMTYR